MGLYRLTCYRESGFVSECPTRFSDLEAAKLSAELALLHFGKDYVIIIEEDDDGSEQIVRPADHDTAGNATAHRAPG